MPLQASSQAWDRVWLVLFILAFFGWMAFMGWDAARIGFTAAPWLQALGGLGIAVYGLGVWWTFRENAFAAPVVKVTRATPRACATDSFHSSGRTASAPKGVL